MSAPQIIYLQEVRPNIPSKEYTGIVNVIGRPVAQPWLVFTHGKIASFETSERLARVAYDEVIKHSRPARR